MPHLLGQGLGQLLVGDVAQLLGDFARAARRAAAAALRAACSSCSSVMKPRSTRIWPIRRIAMVPPARRSNDETRHRRTAASCCQPPLCSTSSRAANCSPCAGRRPLVNASASLPSRSCALLVLVPRLRRCRVRPSRFADSVRPAMWALISTSSLAHFPSRHRLNSESSMRIMPYLAPV